jgi:hypothetical protein
LTQPVDYFKKHAPRESRFRCPWRVRIALCVLRGLMKDPKKALRYARGITIEMKTVMRFNLHLHGEKFLRDFFEEAHRLEMEPFLMWGTLLGCVREGKFLEHDDDLDVGILAADYAKKNALIRAMLARGYRLRHDVPYKFSFETRDRLLNIDVDVLYEHGGLLVNFMPMESTGEPWSHHFPKEAFRGRSQKQLGGIAQAWLPADAEAVLEACYGNWRVPDRNYAYQTGPRNRVADPDKLGIGPGNLPWEEFVA